MNKIVQTIYNDIFLNLHHNTVDMFLCGGASTRNNMSNRDKLREHLKNSKSLSILYPEDLFMELLNRKKYDLLTLEKFLAQNSDIICIVCESPGSFVELGAFVNNENTFDKVVVLLQSKYKNAKSFINQGPVAMVKKNNVNNVIYFNKNIEDATEQVKELLRKRFWRFSYKSLKYKKRTKDINLISGQFYFIMVLLYFYNSINTTKMVQTIKELYLSRGYEEKQFEVVYTAAIRRLYKEGLLKKVQISDGSNFYELTNKGYEQVKYILGSAHIKNSTKIIDGIRLKIIRTSYY
ncbi:MAG: retron St85 family effector protein [Lachnospiraceae bacterium]|nr:retron St85 family effector protein [Lachnospiraceae bacterium]